MADEQPTSVSTSIDTITLAEFEALNDADRAAVLVAIDNRKIEANRRAMESHIAECFITERDAPAAEPAATEEPRQAP